MYELLIFQFRTVFGFRQKGTSIEPIFKSQFFIIIELKLNLSLHHSGALTSGNAWKVEIF